MSLSGCYHWPAKMRRRLRLGGGPSPETPVHSSSSSQSPLSRPSSSSSAWPCPAGSLLAAPPPGRALHRFSGNVTIRKSYREKTVSIECGGKTEKNITLLMNRYAITTIGCYSRTGFSKLGCGNVLQIWNINLKTQGTLQVNIFGQRGSVEKSFGIPALEHVSYNSMRLDLWICVQITITL